MPDESDTALLHVDRGLVRAEQTPPNRAAQERAHQRSRAARWARWSFPVALLVVVVLLLWPGLSGWWIWVVIAVLLLGTAAVIRLLTAAARLAQAAAGLPVPIEITGKVAPAMRSILAMAHAIAGQRALLRSRAAAEGTVLLRRWSSVSDELRAAWLRDDIAAWHEHARTLAAAGERAERVRAEIEKKPADD